MTRTIAVAAALTLSLAAGPASAWFGFFDYRHSLSHGYTGDAHRWRHIDARLDHVFHHMTAKDARDADKATKEHDELERKLTADEEAHEKWHRKDHERWHEREHHHPCCDHHRHPDADRDGRAPAAGADKGADRKSQRR